MSLGSYLEFKLESFSIRFLPLNANFSRNELVEFGAGCTSESPLTGEEEDGTCITESND